MLQVQNVEKYYGSKNNVTKALDRVSFNVEDGEFLVIMGASGSGKTTLLNCISTIDTISVGKILLDGVSVADLSEEALAQFRRERLGFVFQDFNLLDTLTIEENIGLALSLNHTDPKTVQGRVQETAQKLGIADILPKFPYQVSGGQKQRAACARAMVAGQSLLLADEPTGALDSKASKNLLEIMTAMNREMGATILMVSMTLIVPAMRGGCCSSRMAGSLTSCSGESGDGRCFTTRFWMFWPRWGVTSVTLSELSLRNAKRQAKDYLVYFVTIVMAAALLYAFNGLVFSNELQSLAEGMENLSLVIVLASTVVVCVFGWLVSYSTRFMLTRRSRELGTYILIGLTNNQVARLFFLENLAVGGAALLFGMALGGLLYQALRAIVMAMFGFPYHFSLTFSLPAVGLTTAYFALIYLYALRKGRKRIRKMKIYDLIYFDKRNEGVVIQTGKNRRRVFASSIVLGIIGTCLLMARSLLIGIIGAGCVILFLFGFFLCFASGVPAFFDKRPSRKYQNQNLLVYRTLTAKLATMGVLMAVISMIFTATLLTEGSGFVIRGIKGAF